MNTFEIQVQSTTSATPYSYVSMTGVIHSGVTTSYRQSFLPLNYLMTVQFVANHNLQHICI